MTRSRQDSGAECLPGEWPDNELCGTSGAFEICVVTDAATLEEVRQLRKQGYQEPYPAMDLDNDPLDQQAIVLYTRDSSGTIDSTARLSVEGPVELPESAFLDEYRKKGFRVMEWGRFIIVNHDRRLLKSYYRAVYTLASQLGFHAVIMAMKPKDISLHQSLMGLCIIEEDTGERYGGPVSLACVSWELNSTKPRFFKWIKQ